MKVSVVVAVYNEEKTIGELLDSLLFQTLKPQEIIIVDGESRDKTREILKSYQKKDERIRLLVKKSSIAQARNLGVRKARNNIIATTDAGCWAKRDWLEKITKPFDDSSVDAVAGFYIMTGKTAFQRAIAPFLGTVPARYRKENFWPSARSIVFKKSIWLKVGGFSEKMKKAGEDTLFNWQIRLLGAKMAKAKDAVVYWEVPKNLKEGFEKFYYYAYGDAQAKIWWDPSKKFSTHNIKIITVYLRYLAGLTLFVLSFNSQVFLYILAFFSFLYIFYPIWKMRGVVFGWRSRLWLPVIQMTSDFGVMTGFLQGCLKS